MGITKQRRAILQILSESEQHLTADQVFEKVRHIFHNISKGTVYRNLNLMADEGEIRRVKIAEQPIRFDVNTMSHQHIVCVKCGSIADIEDVVPEELRRLAGPETDINDHELIIYAVCKKCLDQ